MSESILSAGLIFAAALNIALLLAVLFVKRPGTPSPGDGEEGHVK